VDGMKKALKRVRVSQPFNLLATSTVRGLLGVLGVRPELVVRHLHRAGTVRCELPNGRVLRLWSRGDDWVANQVFWKGLGGYEPETVPVFLRLAAAARVTLDVGAFVGFYTLLAAHANPSAQVFAFEPHLNAYARLRRNVDVNQVTNVECFQAAAGESSGCAQLFCGSGDLPTSSSLSSEFIGPAGTRSSVDVRVIALDAFIRERGIDHVDVLKIDTESTEPQVLRGIRETLRRDRPAIICEVLQGRGAERPLEDLLRPLGYRYYLLTPTGPRLVTRVTGHREWLNYLFACS
jgi:FkbM family methyltransferase